MSAATNAYQQLMVSLPDLSLALVLVLIGCVLASFIFFLCIRVLRIFAIDKILAKTALHTLLRTVRIHRSPSEILSFLVFLFVLAFFLFFSTRLLHFGRGTVFLGAVVGYLPRLIVAFLIVLFGALGAKVVETLIVRFMQRAGARHEREVAHVVQGVILVVIFLLAVAQLGFELSFITTNVSIAFSVIFALVGFAAILGARPFLENIVCCRQVKSTVMVGTTVEIHGLRGTVREFTSASVVLDDGTGKRIVIPATYFHQYPYFLS